MKKLRNIIFYICIIGGFSALMYWIVLKGTMLENGRKIIEVNAHNDQLSEFINSITINLGHPLAIIIAQIIVIIIFARVLGWIFKKIGQPTVIGEIIAGIVLGPSLLGHFFPEFSLILFPLDSFNNLKVLSQIGLILFMFVVGMELDLKVLKSKAHDAIVISHASIIIPFALGMGLAYFIYQTFAPIGIPFSSFGLFMGISMSITAFPVLARIVQEQGLNKTKIGTIVITCAAADDITAWCLLAVVIAIVKAGSFVSSLYTIVIALTYVIFMIKVVKPFFKRIGDLYTTRENISKSVVALFLVVLLLSSFSTEVIGIHSLFGAFMVGAIMPDNIKFRNIFIEKIEDISMVLLLPLFFVYTGLRTKIGLINDLYLWQITSLIIIVAVIGKFVGSALAAKYVGQSWKDSLTIGALMNTRGLMELVVINIGYDLGVFTEEIFSMMVIMALVTTFMTSPALSLINKLFPDKKLKEEYLRQQAQGIFKVLIALGNPENGKSLLNVAKNVLDGVKNSLVVNVLHITPSADTNPNYSEQFSTESFRTIKSEADLLNTPISTEYKMNDNIELGIVRNTNQNNYDFLLVGAGVSLSGIPFFKQSPIFENVKWLNRLINKISQKQAFFYPGTLIKDKTRYFIENSNCSVGVFVNRGFSAITSTLVLLENESDEFLLRYARRLLKNNSEVSVHIMDMNKLVSSSQNIRKAVSELKQQFPDLVKVSKYSRMSSTSMSKYSFMLISYQAWDIFSNSDKKELGYIPSTLIINKKTSRFTNRSKTAKNTIIDEDVENS